MTQHFLRLKWMPADEAGLLAAYQGGLLEERNWCDLKSSLPLSKAANAELARDLASFSVDGGTLIIGLDEKEPGGSPLTPVDLNQVTAERIEQVAAMKADPPLAVECSVLKAASGGGYLLVHVPASPLAPHQVEGKYLGRGDKTKRYLSDAEVALLIRRRDQWDRNASEIVAGFIAADPFPGRNLPHLFLVAQPVSRNAALCRDLVRGSDYAVKALTLISEATGSPAVRQMLDAAYTRVVPGAPPQLSQLRQHSRTAHGTLLCTTRPPTPAAPGDERWHEALEIREDGGVRYYSSHAGGPAEVNGVRSTGLYLDRMLTTAREILATARELSARSRFAGQWHLGVAVTGILDARPAPSPDPYSFGFLTVHRYTAESFRQTTGASATEIASHPGRVTERLLGQLIRSLTDMVPTAFSD